MESVVKSGMKIDLHIHSCVSSHKDGKKVKKNTIENIPVLIQKLNEQSVNICAITDHDAFSYDMYCALKAAENAGGSIQKVLPGVEFSVRFLDDSNTEKVIHVIGIFSDSSPDKVKNIERVLKTMGPDKNGSFSESAFLDVLRRIDIDTILIAHQKNSLSSRTAQKHDLNTLGNRTFLELIGSDYFEALEFKNKRNEVLNKNFLVAHNLEDAVRFVTGTDCHDWTGYPKETPDAPPHDFPYTFAKCLPTFRGLVMAATDHSRLKTCDSFFGTEKYVLDCISIKCAKKDIKIPLSKGINVIIGDNSVGKSLLLHAMVGFDSNIVKLPSTVKDGYKKYLKRNELEIKKQLQDAHIFAFDAQGEVRRKFSDGKLNADEFLSKYFPEDVDPHPYQAAVETEIDALINYLKQKFEIDSAIENLYSFTLEDGERAPESLSFLKNLRNSKGKSTEPEKIISAIKELEIGIDKIIRLKLDQADLDHFLTQKKVLEQIRKKYEERIIAINQENERIETVAKAIDKIAQRHHRSVSDSQKRIDAFLDNTTVLKDALVKIVRRTAQLKPYKSQISDIAIEPHSNTVHEYEFISRLNTDKIGENYFLQRVLSTMRAHTKIDWATVTEKKLKSLLLKYDEQTPVLEFFRDAILQAIAEDFKPKHAIICQGTDKSAEMSAGLDSRIYFDLLSYESTRDRVYIIDQPEDNVSQMAIKKYLLDYFKTMGERRQVIIVTHNPQFIVNLDVDNLVFLSKIKDGEFNICSGALEYECSNYKVLDIVADNIDGGLDSIRKRWKRYEKANNL